MNRVYLNDHRLADKGWDQMRSILDKEMPQPRKRRPFFWWWAAAACVAGICFLYDRDNSGQQQNAFTTESLPLVESLPAANPGTPGRQTPSIDNTSTGIPSTITAAASSSAINAPAINAQHAVKQQVINTPTSEHSPVGFSEKGISGANDITGNMLNAAITVAKDDEKVTDAVNPTEQSGGTAAGIEKVGTLDVLPSADIAIAADVSSPEMPFVPYSPVTRKATVKNKSSKVTFGFTAGANAFQVKQLPGFLGGFTVDFSLPGRKFGLQSGLIYRYQVFSGESRPVIPVAYDKYVHATANYDIQPDDFPNSWLYLTANNSILIPVMKSHQIEMPAMLFWQMHTRWRMYGGMTMLRHVWVESAQKGLFTYDLQVVTTPDDKAAGNLNNVITGQLPAWEKNWQTGLGFKINKRFELNLFYRSAWKGKPLLSDVSRLFDTCKDCSQYPEAANRTVSSLRPRSLQLNATIKF